MKRKIKFKNKAIEYMLKTSARAKKMRLTVHCEGALVVTKPGWISVRLAESFIAKNLEWIISKFDYFSNLKIKPRSEDRKDYLLHKNNAFNFIEERLKHFSRFYNTPYAKIKIKNQKTRWGSCSRKGNLNFNYKILFLPKNVADYIVVHELCHLKEFNHSFRFWDLVAKAIPDYKDLRRFLKKTRIRGVQDGFHQSLIN